MTAWTTISNALVAVGAKPFASTMQALRDNVIAAFEGDPTAQAAGITLRGEAVARWGTGLPVLTVSAANTYTLPQDSRAGLDFTSGAEATSSTSNVVAATYVVRAYSGTIRLRASHRFQSISAGSSVLELFKNGGLVQSWSTTSGTAVQRTADVAVASNDVFEWRHRRSGGSAPDDSIVSETSITANRAYADTPVWSVVG